MKRAAIVPIVVTLLSVLGASTARGDTQSSLGFGTGEGSTPFTGLAQAPTANLFTGAMGTSIAIEVPPGRKSMTPKLALSYSSAGGQGPYGAGWDLPIGRIERTTKFGAPHEDSPHFDEYIVVLPGLMLELFSAGATYRPKIEEGRFDATLTNNVWTARDRAGTVYTFGSGPESRFGPPEFTTIWYLTGIRDPNGNRIDVTYALFDGVPYPDFVAWGGSATVPFPNFYFVKFEWENRPARDRPLNYQHAARMHITRRLHRLRVIQLGECDGPNYTPPHIPNCGANVGFRAYVFRYKNARGVLKAVHVGVPQADGTVLRTFPSQTFTYQKVNDGFVHKSYTDASGITKLRLIDSSFEVQDTMLDMDGDGRLDHVQARPAWGGAWRVRLGCSPGSNRPLQCNRAYGFASTYVTWQATMDGGFVAETVRDVLQNCPAGGGQCSRWDTFDMTGDGIPDFVRARAVGGWLVHRGEVNGSTRRFNPTPIVWTAPGGKDYIRWDAGDFLKQDVRDMTGDGLVDLVVGGTNSWNVHANTGSGFDPSPRVVNSPFPDLEVTGNDANAHMLLDFNADGLPDLVKRSSADFDATCGGAGFGGKSCIYVYFNTSRGFDTTATAVTVPWRGWKPGSGDDITKDLLDVNGDGLPDFVDTNPDSGNETRVALNRGSSFEEPVLVNGVYVGASVWSSLPPGLTLRDSTATSFVDMADVDGDGRLDRVQSSNNGTWNLYLNSNPTQTRPRTDVLKAMLNGMGGKTTLLYRPSTDFPNNNRLPIVTWVTTAIRQTDGLCTPTANVYDRTQNPCINAGFENVVTYRYANGLFDAGAREFRGFERVVRRDVDGNETTQFFSQDEYTKGRVLVVETRAGSMLVKRETTGWNTTLLGGVRRQVWLGASVERIFDDLGESSGMEHKLDRRNISVDANGNVTLSERTGSSLRLETVTQYDAGLSGIHVYDRPSFVSKKNDAGTVLEQQWFEYDARGNPTRIDTLDTSTAPVRIVSTSMEYGPFGDVIAVVDGNNNRSETKYDPTVGLFPEEEKDALGRIVKKEFDYRTGANKPIQVIDENNQVTLYTYDLAGRLSSVKRPLETLADSEHFEYHYGDLEGFSGVVSFKREPASPNQYLKHTEYFDALGRSRGSTMSRRVGSSVTPVLIGVFVEYDAAGRVSRRYAPYSFSGGGALSNGYTAFDYHLNGGPMDPLGRVHRTTQPNGQSTTVRYKGHVREQYDELGYKTVARLNAEGQAFQTELYNEAGAFNSSVVNSYDAMGRLVQIQQNQSVASQIQITVDTMGRKTRVVDPDSGTWTYRYDTVGNLIFEDDPKTGQAVQYCYDGLKRLTRKFYLASDTTTKNCATAPFDPATEDRYTYDLNLNGIGRLSKVEDASGSSEFFYDARGRVVSQIKTILGKTATTQFQYDLADRITGTRYPDNTSFSTAYDQSGQAKALGTVVSDVQYDVFGRPTRTQRGNGTVDVRTFADESNNHRLTRIQATGPGGALLDLQYASYTVRGQLQALIDGVHSGVMSNTTLYGYDFARRLTAIGSEAVGGQTYAYDTFGNFLQKEGRNYFYGTKPHQPTRVESGGQNVFLTHDANGNRISKDTTTYTYDRGNRLKTISVPGHTIEFAYDYRGERVAKTVDGATRTRYYNELFEVTGSTQTRHFMLAGIRVASSDSAVPGGSTYASAAAIGGGSFAAVMTHWGDRPVLKVILDEGAQGGVLAFVALLLGACLVGQARRRLGVVSVRAGTVAGVVLLTALQTLPFAIVLIPTTADAQCDPPVSNARHYHQDHLGSTQVISNSAGAVLTEIRYTPWGLVRHRSGTVSSQNRYEFTGYETEGFSNLEYAGLRFYDPDLGLFQTHDPERQFKSPYSYGDGDPVNRIDPNGAEFFTALIVGFVIGFVASAIGAAIQGASFEQVLKSALIGGAIGGATGGIADLAVGGLETVVAAISEKLGTTGTVSAESVGQLAAEGSQLYSLGSGVSDAVDGDYTGLISFGLGRGYAQFGGESGPAPTDDTGIDLAGRIYNLPNTILGGGWALINRTFGGTFTFIDGVLHNESAPIQDLFGGAITIGEVISYPGARGAELSKQPGVSIEAHELPHVGIGRNLGPLYLPANILGMTASLIHAGLICGPGAGWMSAVHGPANLMERGPLSTPPKRW